MKTIIINQQRQPEQFKVLQDAMTNGTEVEGGYVARYYEYTTAGEKFGMFTLVEADYGPPRFGP